MKTTRIKISSLELLGEYRKYANRLVVFLNNSHLSGGYNSPNVVIEICCSYST
jgi:hypothetical protein